MRLRYSASVPRIFYRNFLIFTAILLLCVVSLGYVLISGEKQIDKSSEWIFHTHEVIIESEQLNTHIAQMVSSQRGYLISGNDKLLEEYRYRKGLVSKHIANLSGLTVNNASQQSRLDEMRQYFIKLTEQLEEKMLAGVPDASKQMLDDAEVVKGLKADIFQVNADFLEEEYNLLNKRVQIVESRKDQYFMTLIIGGGVAVILLMIFNGYLLTVQTKRSAAETALSEQEEIFKIAIEGMQDGVFDWNIKTGQVFFSDQYISMLGYEPSDFKGTVDDFVSRLHPDEKDKVWEYVDLYLDGDLSEYSNTFRMQHKSGRWVWINARAKLLRDQSGKPERMVGAHTDISAAKDYEMKLQEAKVKAEEANRAKSDFLAHMSHEIRTPLTTISGAAEILDQSKDMLDEKKRNLVKVLNTSSTILKDLISDVLDFSKIESGELELEENAFDLRDAFEHIISIMAVKANEKDLDFKFDFDDVKDKPFYGDPVRLRQILINLIANAVKFTDEGHVHVYAKEKEIDGLPVLEVRVEDSGIGIKEEQFELIFERFKQGDSSVSRKFAGTGLGLPISKRLASLMGGDIHVESQYGKGSVFSLILPLRTVESVREDEKEDDVVKDKIHDKLKNVIAETDKILLVEDYEGNVVVLSYILESMDIEFDVAKTGLEAVNLWKESFYNVVLMDIQMPEMDGFTATKQIRKIEEEKNLEHTPIIGMTAHALVGDKDKCIEAGMDAYLPKPIVEADLKSTLYKFLRTKQNAA